METKDVVPVLGRRAKSGDGGMKLDHTMSHGVAGGVGVEAAEDGQRRMEQGGEPSGVGSGAGCGQASIGRIHGVATDGVNGRFAKDDGLGGGNGGPPGSPAPDQADARSNPRYLGDFDRTTRVGLMHSSALGADGRIYFGGFGLRHYTGGGFGWYDPKTGNMDGFWRPLSGYAVHWITAASEGRLIVISTTRAADELNGNRAPEEARLFVYYVSTQKLVRDLVPIPKGRTTGLITEVAPGRVLGLTSNPAREDGSVLYEVDVTTGEVLFNKPLPSPVSTDAYWPHWVDPSYGYHAFARGPDGFVWTYLKNALARIDPGQAAVQVVGEVEPVG